MQSLMAIIVILTFVITIGLGFLQYNLGKKQKNNRTGIIAPVSYLVVRCLLVIFTSSEDSQIIASILGAFLIAGIYWWIFTYARKHAAK